MFLMLSETATKRYWVEKSNTSELHNTKQNNKIQANYIIPNFLKQSNTSRLHNKLKMTRAIQHLSREHQIMNRCWGTIDTNRKLGIGSSGSKSLQLKLTAYNQCHHYFYIFNTQGLGFDMLWVLKIVEIRSSIVFFFFHQLPSK